MNRELPFTNEQLNGWRSQYRTPFYVYDEKAIRERVAAVREAFAWNAGYGEYFAVKALPTPAILRLLESLGCGADCASIPEILLAEASGMSGERIIFTSNQTRPEEYRMAKEAGAIINLDDLTQVENLRNACGFPDMVCLRYNPGKFPVDASYIGRLDQSKFGMPRDQLFGALKALREGGVRRFGIHGMFAGNALNEDYYPSSAKVLFELAVDIQKELGIELSLIDFGGGMGIPYQPEDRPVDIRWIGARVRECYETILIPNGLRPRLCTEMGRYITGPAGYLVTTVVGKKNGHKAYIGVDASPADLIRPAMYGAYHEILLPGKESLPADGLYDVVGPLCENNDKFAVDRSLPKAEIGDALVICDAGAHGRSMGFNYNGRLRCGEFLLKGDGSLQMIRRAETTDDYFATLDVDETFMNALKRLC